MKGKAAGEEIEEAREKEDREEKRGKGVLGYEVEAEWALDGGTEWKRKHRLDDPTEGVPSVRPSVRRFASFALLRPHPSLMRRQPWLNAAAAALAAVKACSS